MHIQHFITLIARTAGPFTKFRGKGFHPVALIPARVDRRIIYAYVEPGLLVYTARVISRPRTRTRFAYCLSRGVHVQWNTAEIAVVMSHACAARRGANCINFYVYALPTIRHRGNRHKILCFTGRLRCRAHPSVRKPRVKRSLRTRILPSALDSRCIDLSCDSFVVMLIYVIFFKGKAYY